MSKLFAFILCIIIIANPNISYAKTEVYNIDDLKISVSIPNEYHVAQYPVSAPNSFLDITGISASELNSYFYNNKIYLNAVGEDLSTEIIIYTKQLEIEGEVDLDITTFENMSDADLSDKFLEMFGDSATRLGFKASEVTLYNHKQTKFIRSQLSGNMEGVDTYIDSYFALHNGKAIYLALKSYGGPISNAERQNGEQIVNSIVFMSPIDSKTKSEREKQGGTMLDNFIIGAASAAVLIIGASLAKWVASFFDKKRKQ